MKRKFGYAILIAVGSIVVASLITATPEGLVNAVILGVIGGLVATMIVLGITLIN